MFAIQNQSHVSLCQFHTPSPTPNNNLLLIEMDHYKHTLTNYLLKKPTPLSSIPSLQHTSHPSSSYLSIPILLRHLQNGNPLDQTFSKYFQQIPSDYHTTQAYQSLNLKLWTYQTQQPDSIKFKEHSSYLRILSEWMNLYEGLVSKLEERDSCFNHLLEFINTKTKTYLERIVFIEEIYDDLKETIDLKYFWEEVEEGTMIKELTTSIDNLDSLLGILEVITFKSVVKYKPEREQNGNNKNEEQSAVWLYSPLLRIIQNSSKYQDFVFRGLCYILLHSDMLDKVEKNLTLTIFKFATFTKKDSYVIHLLKQCLTRTSKAVQFALLSQYQVVLETLEHQKRQELMDVLEDMYEVRQLIKKKVETGMIEFRQHQRNSCTILNGESKVFYFEVTKPGSILFLEFYVNIDITVILTRVAGLCQQTTNEYFREEKSKNKTFQILVNNRGLHTLTFDNSYSWMTSKDVVFSLNVLKPEEGDNDGFNLLMYPDEHTRLDRCILGDIKQETEEQKELISIWNSNIGDRCDIVVRNGKVLFQGAVLKVGKLKLTASQMESIRSVLIVGEEMEFLDIVQEVKRRNGRVKIRRCEEEDF